MALSELQTRVLTALAGIPVLLAVFWLGGPVLSCAVLVICLLAFRELNSLYQAKGVGHSWWLVLAYVVLAPLTAGLPHSVDRHLTRGGVDFLHFWGGLTFIWLLILLLREMFSRREEVLASIGASVLIGLLSTLPFVPLVALDRQLSPGTRSAVMLGLLLCTWATDTFAYFGGRLFGRHKLFERASPKKTVEGFLCGLAGSLAVGAGSGLLCPQGRLGQGLLIGALVGLLGPAGDLLESRLKRDAGVKDSARMLPGHGGVLDRFDTWIFAAPALYLVAWLGWLR
ncbi:MAG: phosphatidate cytidylyltransferase [Candidatus Delongbacteria bacterium]